ncbi:MAG: HEAT repeat domain-containing protein [Oligoflexia bacterium]|nr:HEAT repeat domain-containing protein [Oligoflexia bacterium]
MLGVRFLGFLFTLLVFVSSSAFGQTDNRLRLMFLDVEDPHEVDSWIVELNLQPSPTCPSDYCNDEFIASRPTLHVKGQEEILKYIKEKKIFSNAVFISGHHSAGFFGVKGRFSKLSLEVLTDDQACLPFFCKPKFVYLGGCYTTASRFAEVEIDPYQYLQRVLTHENEVPRTQLIISAIHQIANKGDKNPYAPVFPNATLFGYDERGPGKNSIPYIKILVSSFLNYLKQLTRAPTSSTALFELLKLDRNHSHYAQASKWWSEEGSRVSTTKSASYFPDHPIMQSNIDLEKFQKNTKSQTELLFQMSLALIDNSNTWGFTVDQSRLLLQDLDNALEGAASPPTELKNKLTQAALKILSDNPTQKVLALHALRISRSDNPSVHKMVAQELKNEDIYIRQAAIKALDKFQSKDHQILEAILEAFSDSNEMIRAFAASVVGRMKPKDHKTHLALAGLLQDQTESVVLNALDALVTIETTDASILQTIVSLLKTSTYKDVKIRAAYVFQFIKHRNEVINLALGEALNDSNSFVRLNAALALGLNKNSLLQAQSVLVELLNDSEPWVRANAVRGLGVIKSPNTEIQMAISKMISDSDANTRMNAILALIPVKVQDTSILAAITLALTDSDEFTRLAAQDFFKARAPH